MVGMMGKGKMGGSPMGPGMGPMAGMMGEEDLFGSGPSAGAEVGDEAIDKMFSEEEDMGTPEDKLYAGLSQAGYAPTPEQMQQILAILEGGGGMAPEGVKPTETGMETTPEM